MGRHPPPALYKGSGLGLGRPARPIKIRKAQGARTDPPPQPATDQFPASTVCHPRHMGDTWRTCKTEGTGETTTPHPVIVGSGRLEDRASAPFSKWAAPPRLPPFMGKARAASLLRCDACMREPPHACRPRHVHPSMPRHAARGSWEVKHGKSFTAVKTAPPARAPFWAWPNNALHLCVTQARGILSVY